VQLELWLVSSETLSVKVLRCYDVCKKTVVVAQDVKNGANCMRKKNREEEEEKKKWWKDDTQ